MELSFDITDMKKVEKYFKERGIKTICPSFEFDMGRGLRASAIYIEDKDGTIFELTEIIKFAYLPRELSVLLVTLCFKFLKFFMRIKRNITI